MDSSTVRVAAMETLEAWRDEVGHGPTDILTPLLPDSLPIASNTGENIGNEEFCNAPQQAASIKQATLRQCTAESSPAAEFFIEGNLPRLCADFLFLRFLS
jgi:hypothetical protein